MIQASKEMCSIGIRKIKITLVMEVLYVEIGTRTNCYNLFIYLAGRNAQEVFYSLILDLSKHRAAIRGYSCQASPMPIHKSTGYNILEAVLRAQARRNEFESEWARLSKPLTPSPAKSWTFKQSNPIKTDTEGAIESVGINGVSIKRVFALMQTGPFIKHS